MAKHDGVIKGYDLTAQLYENRAKALEQAENNFLNKLSAESKEPIEKLLKLTSDSEQNRELEEAISFIESEIGDPNSPLWTATSKEEAVQKWAVKIIELDKNIQALGADGSGLQELAKGNYKKVMGHIRKGEIPNIVPNQALNEWMFKTIKKIGTIYNKHQKGANVKTPTGTLSNLKGAYLEAAVTNILSSLLPQSAQADGTKNISIDVINSGNIRQDKRQMAEDILLIFGDNSKKTFKELLENPPKGKYYSIGVPAYQELQTESVGITVKAGNAPIKFYQGNLDSFFSYVLSDIDVKKYHQNVLLRSVTPMQDNIGGRSVNYWIVANSLDKAMGMNNIFISTRNNLLSRTSEYVRHLGNEESFLYMTSYKINKPSISGRIVSRK